MSRDSTAIKSSLVKWVLRRPVPLSFVNASATAQEMNVSAPVVLDDGKIVCNINFDDLCPKYMDEDGLDYGGRPGEGVSGRLARLFSAWPDVAVTVFVIPDSRMKRCRWRLGARRGYDISTPQYDVWRAFYESLEAKYSLELAVHGLHHWQTENPLFGRHTEFAFKTETEAEDSVKRALAIFLASGWEPVGFRQPGWAITADLSLIRVLRRCGFRYIAGSTPDGGLNVVVRRVPVDHPAVVNGLVNIPQNVNLDWPLEQMKRRVAQIVAASGIISIKGHFVDRNDTNCFSEENYNKLLRLIEHVLSKYSDRLTFRTCSEIAETVSATETVEPAGLSRGAAGEHA